MSFVDALGQFGGSGGYRRVAPAGSEASYPLAVRREMALNVSQRGMGNCEIGYDGVS
jgi:hypothetical protein